MAPESFELALGSPVKLDFADVTANLHAIGTGVHAESAADGSGYSDKAFHAAEVVSRAESYSAAKVGRGVDLGKIAFEDDIRLRRDELKHHPGQFAVAHEQVRAAPEKLVRNAVGVEEIQELWNCLVLVYKQQVGGAADAERGEFSQGSPWL